MLNRQNTASYVIFTTLLIVSVSQAFELGLLGIHNHCRHSRKSIAKHAAFQRYCIPGEIVRNLRGVRRSVITLQETNSKQENQDDKTLQEDVKEANQVVPVSSEQAMALLGTSPRRIFLSFTAGTIIALGTNFLGGTSAILSLLPEDAVEQSGLDLAYPRGPFKRVRGTAEYGYSFLIPRAWVADTAVELAKAVQRTKTLDYSMSAVRRREASVIPDVAFGPPGSGSTSRTNVSVVVSKVMPGFTLGGTLGTPENAAETLLQTTIAPEGSGRKATLLNANEEFRGTSNIYQFEYLLDFDNANNFGANARLRAISVIAERNQDTLITLTVVAPDTEWEQEEKNGASRLRKIAESFKLYK